MIWWVAYQRGSFNLKECYPCMHRARARCVKLFTQTQNLRIIAGDDVEGLASLAHCLELPAPESPEPC
jgi:hypothetical protein